MLEHVQLDQKTINKDLLDGGAWDAEVVAADGDIPDYHSGHGAGRVRVYDEQGPGRDWSEQAGAVGFLPGQLRVLDRDKPRGDNDLGDTASDAGGVAASGYAGGGGYDGVLADGGAAYASVPRGQAVARLLGFPVRLRAGGVAECAVAVRLGPEARL